MSSIVLFAGRVRGSQKRAIRRVPELIRRLWEKADMETTQVRPWDPAEHLETEEDMAAYLNAALEEGDPRLTIAALEDMARAKGRAEVAQETGVGRENLYKCPSTTTLNSPPC